VNAPSDAEPVTHFCREDWVALLAIMAATVALFLPSLPYEFLNWDDHVYIHGNPWLLNLTWENVVGVFRFPYFSNYHPLTMLSYMVDFQFFGYEPEGYRAINIALHAMTVGTMFALLRAMGVPTRLTALFVLFFAVHPLRVESVVWVSERKDVLCGLFYTLAIFCWVKGTGRIGGRWVWLGGAALCTVLALLSKAMAVSLPLVLLLWDVLYRRGELLRRLPLHGALLCLAVLFAIWNKAAQSGAVIEGVPLWDRLALAAWAPVHYSMSTVWPAGLTALYPIELRPSQSLPFSLLGAGFCVVALVVVVRSLQRAPEVAFGLLAAALCLGPVSGIVVFGGAYAADRYSYLPSILLFAGFAVYTGRLLASASSGTKTALAVGALVICAAMAIVTVRTMPHWRTSETVWARVLAVYPDSTKAQFNQLHSRLRGEGEPPSADEVASERQARFKDVWQAQELLVSRLLVEKRFDEALAATEGLPERAMALSWQIRILREKNDLAGMKETALAVLALDPPGNQAEAALALLDAGDEQRAEEALSSFEQPSAAAAAVWGRFARVVAARGDDQKTEQYGRRALAIHPAESNAVEVLGDNFTRLGRLEEARAIYRKAARHPAATASLRCLALTRWGMIERRLAPGTQRAAELFEEAFSIEPPPDASPADRAALYNYMGFRAEEAGGREVAEGLYRRAIEAVPDHAEALQNLAIVLISQNRKADALGYLERAAAAAPEDETIRANLDRLKGELGTSEAEADAPR